MLKQIEWVQFVIIKINGQVTRTTVAFIRSAAHTCVLGKGQRDSGIPHCELQGNHEWQQQRNDLCRVDTTHGTLHKYAQLTEILRNYFTEECPNAEAILIIITVNNIAAFVTRKPGV